MVTPPIWIENDFYDFYNIQLDLNLISLFDETIFIKDDFCWYTIGYIICYLVMFQDSLIQMFPNSKLSLVDLESFQSFENANF